MKIANYEVVGFKSVNYINKGGRKVEGYVLYLLCTEEVDGVVGTEVGEAWASRDMSPNIGNEYKCVRFNGRITILQ